MQIWIDADACPRAVKDIIFRAAARTQTKTHVVANKAQHIPRAPTLVMVQVPGGPDVADDHIVAHARPGDIAVTADIPLAARLVAADVVVISPRGEVFDADNVGERLSVRDFLSDLRDSGVVTAGPRAFSERDKRQFAGALDRALARAGR